MLLSALLLHLTMIGIRLLGVLINRFRLNQFITSIGLFSNEWDFTWRVSDCEELVGVIRRLKL